MLEASAYSIHLYCDYPNCKRFGEFVGKNEPDCLSQARRAGWKVSRKHKCYCPKHFKFLSNIS